MLNVENLVIHYETDEEVVEAVNNISFRLKKGEVLGLVGETGAGKTTTALGIMGLLPPKVGHVIQGKIEDDLLFDNRVLANDCVTMVDAILKGEKPEISDYEQYDNGTKIVGTVTSDIQLIDADNYQMLVDDGYYEENEIMPEATAPPTPKVTPEATVTEEPDIDENTTEAASASSEKEETEISGTPTPEETVTPTPSEKPEKDAAA